MLRPTHLYLDWPWVACEQQVKKENLSMSAVTFSLEFPLVMYDESYQTDREEERNEETQTVKKRKPDAVLLHEWAIV